MDPGLRDTLARTASDLSAAVQAGNVPAVRSATVTALAGNFGATEALVRATGAELAGDTLTVRQLYVLDATSRTSAEAGAADFACPLADVASSETDFSISGLPAGRFAFAMVEASGGAHPWLLAYLLQQEGPAATGTWKMAGFYPHPRTAGGHDGLWYWRDARTKLAGREPWLAWLEFGEADTLLRPAAFVTSTSLDALHTEQRTAAPAGLANGPSMDSPLVLKAAAGTEFRITQMAAQATDNDGPLRLLLHVEAQGSTDPAAMRARGTAAAQALVSEHPELRAAFTGVLLLVEPAGGSPEVVSLPMNSLPMNSLPMHSLQ